MSSILASVARAAFRRARPALLDMANSLARFITRPRPGGDIVDVAHKNVINSYLFSNAVLSLYFIPKTHRITREGYEKMNAIIADDDEEGSKEARKQGRKEVASTKTNIV